jgi:BarA-like signal transduction histidine kinase
LTLGDGGGSLLNTNLLAKLLPAVEFAYGSTIVELDLSSKRSLLDFLLLCLRLCAHMLTQATKLMLEGCTRIRLKPMILKPEWTTLDSGL